MFLILIGDKNIFKVYLLKNILEIIFFIKYINIKINKL